MFLNQHILCMSGAGHFAAMQHTGQESVGSWRRNNSRWITRATGHSLLRAGPCSKGSGLIPQCWSSGRGQETQVALLFFSLGRRSTCRFFLFYLPNTIFTTRQSHTHSEADGRVPSGTLEKQWKGQRFRSYPDMGWRLALSLANQVILIKLCKISEPQAFLTFSSITLRGVI